MSNDTKKPTSALEALSDPNTIVLVLDSAVEQQIVMRYLKKEARKAIEEQRVLTVLHLLQLAADKSVCAVFRDVDTPAYTYAPDASGVIRHRLRPDAELFAEMIVTKPIKVGDYWDRPNATSMGVPNNARFLGAIQPTLLPFRLDYIDKGNDPPREMKLATL